MLPTLSGLSVSHRPGGRLRHWCSSRYLRISPLHREFRHPLRDSSLVVSNAVPGLSPGISHPTYLAAYTRFTPNNSEQRLHPPYYRGCWHGVSRCFLWRYRQTAKIFTTRLSSLPTEVYDPRAFIPHAELLCQGFPHCTRFPTAASRRSLDRVSVPVWLIILSDQLTIVALVSRYLTNKLMVRGLINWRQLPRRGHLFPHRPKTSWSYSVLAPVSRGYPKPKGRLSTRYSPVRHFTRHPKVTFSFDLHVLSTPPAFVLSQDQTLQFKT